MGYIVSPVSKTERKEGGGKEKERKEGEDRKEKPMNLVSFIVIRMAVLYKRTKL